jgi:hypothetical protein
MMYKQIGELLVHKAGHYYATCDGIVDAFVIDANIETQKSTNLLYPSQWCVCVCVCARVCVD